MLTAARQLREKLIAAEERANRTEERLACAEQALAAQDERLERTELDGRYTGRLALVLALGMGCVAGLASIAFGLAGALWWRL